MSDQKLYDELRTLAEKITPDQTFVNQLETQLKEMPMNTVSLSSVRRTRWLFAAAAAFVLIVGAFLTVPPLRTWAQDVIERLFFPMPSDEQHVVYHTVDLSTMPRTESESAMDALELGFDILMPSVMVSGLTFNPEMNTYDDNPPYLSMSYTDGEIIVSIFEMQLQRGQHDTWDEVGASAEIIPVTLTLASGETVTAQYVQGAWSWIDPPGSPTRAPGQGIDTVMTWNSDIPMRRIRWQQGDMIIEVNTTTLIGIADHVPTLDDLIAIAQGLR